MPLPKSLILTIRIDNEKVSGAELEALCNDLREPYFNPKLTEEEWLQIKNEVCKEIDNIKVNNQGYIVLI